MVSASSMERNFGSNDKSQHDRSLPPLPAQTHKLVPWFSGANSLPFGSNVLANLEERLYVVEYLDTLVLSAAHVPHTSSVHSKLLFHILLE